MKQQVHVLPQFSEISRATFRIICTKIDQTGLPRAQEGTFRQAEESAHGHSFVKQLPMSVKCMSMMRLESLPDTRPQTPGQYGIAAR